MKIITVAILGVGSRGGDSYGIRFQKHGGYRIASLCDKRQGRLDRYSKEFGVDPSQCFLDEEEFFAEKRADVCVVSTQDRDHVRQAIRAMKLGYDILLEKPISPVKEELLELLDVQKQTGRTVLVCHVLRYAPAYRKVASLIQEGAIGTLIDIHGIEQVAYYHQAHSFVRGNWRREDETSPMIMAKCCHDMDLLQFWAGARCDRVSSFGDLRFFKKENQPKDAADRCEDCVHKRDCPYSAYRLYIDSWKTDGCRQNAWPMNVVCIDPILTEEGIEKAFRSNGYGRCVFACDNDVVDHQETNLLFENGVTVNLCMTAFTGTGGRIYRFHGTLGEIDLDEEESKITVKRFTGNWHEAPEIIPFAKLLEVDGGHGGGDQGIVDDLYRVVALGEKPITTISESVESHLMALAAEESRKEGGKLVFVRPKR